ncbi:hypothetical protein BLNAU_741 [Blattamonas nauphoetae]|uniref:Tesmin/TSO1-like CXC domain-containing protein n=1 Tax=Blattamonas nauphoetae TaxID=2049346 RepID=A0ABQ9YKC5_9EUKA|nr:hypothetical protein BLNAU_741 [Blattamonas nauphoetae]
MQIGPFLIPLTGTNPPPQTSFIPQRHLTNPFVARAVSEGNPDVTVALLAEDPRNPFYDSLRQWYTAFEVQISYKSLIIQFVHPVHMYRLMIPFDTIERINLNEVADKPLDSKFQDGIDTKSTRTQLEILVNQRPKLRWAKNLIDVHDGEYNPYFLYNPYQPDSHPQEDSSQRHVPVFHPCSPDRFAHLDGLTNRFNRYLFVLDHNDIPIQDVFQNDPRLLRLMHDVTPITPVFVDTIPYQPAILTDPAKPSPAKQQACQSSYQFLNLQKRPPQIPRKEEQKDEMGSFSGGATSDIDPEHSPEEGQDDPNTCSVLVHADVTSDSDEVLLLNLLNRIHHKSPAYKPMKALVDLIQSQKEMEKTLMFTILHAQAMYQQPIGRTYFTSPLSPDDPQPLQLGGSTSQPLFNFHLPQTSNEHSVYSIPIPPQWFFTPSQQRIPETITPLQPSKKHEIGGSVNPPYPVVGCQCKTGQCGTKRCACFLAGVGCTHKCACHKLTLSRACLVAPMSQDGTINQQQNPAILFARVSYTQPMQTYFHQPETHHLLKSLTGADTDLTEQSLPTISEPTSITPPTQLTSLSESPLFQQQILVSEQTATSYITTNAHIHERAVHALETNTVGDYLDTTCCKNPFNIIFPAYGILQAAPCFASYIRHMQTSNQQPTTVHHRKTPAILPRRKRGRPRKTIIDSGVDSMMQGGGTVYLQGNMAVQGMQGTAGSSNSANTSPPLTPVDLWRLIRESEFYEIISHAMVDEWGEDEEEMFQKQQMQQLQQYIDETPVHPSVTIDLVERMRTALQTTTGPLDLNQNAPLRETINALKEEQRGLQTNANLKRVLNLDEHRKEEGVIDESDIINEEQPERIQFHSSFQKGDVIMNATIIQLLTEQPYPPFVLFNPNNPPPQSRSVVWKHIVPLSGLSQRQTFIVQEVFSIHPPNTTIPIPATCIIAVNEVNQPINEGVSLSISGLEAAQTELEPSFYTQSMGDSLGGDGDGGLSKNYQNPMRPLPNQLMYPDYVTEIPSALLVPPVSSQQIGFSFCLGQQQTLTLSGMMTGDNMPVDSTQRVRGHLTLRQELHHCIKCDVCQQSPVWHCRRCDRCTPAIEGKPCEFCHPHKKEGIVLPRKVTQWVTGKEENETRPKYTSETISQQNTAGLDGEASETDTDAELDFTMSQTYQLHCNKHMQKVIAWVQQAGPSTDIPPNIAMEYASITQKMQGLQEIFQNPVQTEDGPS